MSQAQVFKGFDTVFVVTKKQQKNRQKLSQKILLKFKNHQRLLLYINDFLCKFLSRIFS